MTGRLPDFVVVGTMKSGTTSLFRWLGAQPGCVLPAVKEPTFFSDDAAHARGLDAYRATFAGIPDDVVTGEASVAYSSPTAATTAARLVAALPAVRLVCVVRHPIERLRSHHQHEVQRGREKRTLAEAITATSAYATWSGYGTCVGPWIDAARDRLLVVRFEDLVGPDDTAWRDVLDHVGLPTADRPDDMHNRSGEKSAFSPAMRRLYDAGVRRPPKLAPGAVRRLAKRVLLRDAPAADDRPLPAGIAESVWHDVAVFEDKLGRGPLWERDA